jgi:DNA-binding MarR family transcriptional regulator
MDGTTNMSVYQGLNAILRIAREEFGDAVNLQQLQAFLLVAERSSISISELAELTDLSLSTASRYVAWFSRYGDRGKPALNVWDIVEDPGERRRKLVRLNENGERVYGRIRAALGAAFTPAG